MMTNKQLADELGFYYLVYFPNPETGRVKCFLDGAADYVTLSHEGLVALIPGHNDVVYSLKGSLNQYQGFLWGVLEGTISPIHPKYEFIPYKEALDIRDRKEARKAAEKGVNEGSIEPAAEYWNKNIESTAANRVQIKIPR